GPVRGDGPFLQEERSGDRAPGRADPQHLHALPGGQRAHARRALRLDGVVGSGVLQLRAGRTHQHRRPRERRRRHAHLPHSRLGFHRDEYRRGTLGIHLDIPVETVEDWGLFGYWMGDWVQERVEVITGAGEVPNLPKLKHFGAAASSSGGVEMFHLVGITPEANTEEQAYGGNKPTELRHYGARERAGTLERINATGHDRKVDYVMLGCPHYTIEQIWEAAELLEGRKVHADTAQWIDAACTGRWSTQ